MSPLLISYTCVVGDVQLGGVSELRHSQLRIVVDYFGRRRLLSRMGTFQSSVGLHGLPVVSTYHEFSSPL